MYSIGGIKETGVHKKPMIPLGDVLQSLLWGRPSGPGRGYAGFHAVVNFALKLFGK
jgi:hypothetical protein